MLQWKSKEQSNSSMYSEQSGVFVDEDKRRTCAHFLHFTCAQDVKNDSRLGRNCPICRADFFDVTAVPDPIKDPPAWFKVVDLNGDGRLSQQELLEVARAQLPVDHYTVERELPALWRRWDADGNGFISERELLDPSTGMLAYFRENFPRADGEDPIPDIRTDRRGWFAYFDYNKSQTLEKGEVVRAIVKTLAAATPASDSDVPSFERSDSWAREMAGIVEAVWVAFDHDGSGEIDLEEFCRADGLCDSLVASLLQVR